MWLDALLSPMQSCPPGLQAGWISVYILILQFKQLKKKPSNFTVNSRAAQQWFPSLCKSSGYIQSSFLLVNLPRLCDACSQPPAHFMQYLCSVLWLIKKNTLDWNIASVLNKSCPWEESARDWTGKALQQAIESLWKNDGLIHSLSFSVQH